jgi:hypothetical protein
LLCINLASGFFPNLSEMQLTTRRGELGHRFSDREIDELRRGIRDLAAR